MMTEHLFMVIRTRGAAWVDLLSMESQEDWEAHASFMSSLEQDGVVVLEGPLEGTSDVLLVVRARTNAEIISRLSADPWTRKDLLSLSRIIPWTLRLGSLTRGERASSSSWSG
jgi:uncharacterized protein YciI